jgi:hypothetical protein
LSAIEYGKLLDRIETDLRVWESALRKIDPGKGETSYKVGSDIANYKDFGLRETQSAVNLIIRQRAKRTVYGEIALAGLLDTLNDAITHLAGLGAFNDLSIEKMRDFGDEMGTVEVNLRNDGMRRLQFLESNPCAQ